MYLSVITSPFCELPPDAIGAIERRWFNTCEVLSSRGHDVHLVGKRGATRLPNKEHLKRTYVSGYDRTKSIYLDIVLDFFFSFRALCAVDRCDILVCNTFWGSLLAPIFFRRKYKKLVYNVARYPKRHLKLYNGVDMFVCTSNVVKRALLEVVPNSKTKRVVVVNNPIDVSVFNNDGAEVPRKSDILIGYHGRIHPEKGLELLSLAVSKCAKNLPSVRLRLIGSWSVAKGGGGEKYKDKLDELSGHRIEWCGPIADRVELAAKLRECSLYCYPSIAEQGETFGVSPLEAMGLGLPVIVSKLECFSDFIEDGVNGLVFNHRGGMALSDLTGKLSLLASDKVMRDVIGRNAATTAHGFSTEKMAEKYAKVFSEILGEGLV